MKEYLVRVIKILGIDGAIFYTLLSRGLQIGTSLFTVFFITKYLSADEQGYYYTFGSIVAIQVFFELGLTGTITQFVAHEASHLNLGADNKLTGEEKYKSRLSSLFRFCVIWYLVFAIILLVVLIAAGYYFFNKYEDSSKDILWKLPWVLLAIGTALNLLIAPIVAFIEGLGKVKEVAQIRLIQQFIHPIIIWGGLILGSKLYVSGIDTIITVLVLYIIIFNSSFKSVLENIWDDFSGEKINYMKEILPYQWRIALSWISGFFIFQIFNPVLFATEGANIAGQMGMTMTAFNAIQALALSWINTKVPKLSHLIAQRDYNNLDQLFFLTMKQIILVALFGLFSFVLVLYFIQIYNINLLGIDIGERFLPFKPLLFMAFSTFTIILVSCWATYLRCHKKEPLLANSITIGILSCTSTIFLGKYYGLMGIVIGFAIIRLFSVVWVFSVFKKKKLEWHEQ